MTTAAPTERKPEADRRLDGRHRSLWLREVLAEPSEPAPPLRAPRARTWRSPAAASSGCGRAIRIKEARPGLRRGRARAGHLRRRRVGRNGGMVLSWWPKLVEPGEVCGDEEAVRLGRASAAAIDELGELLRGRTGSTATSVRGGLLWTATTPAHDRRLGGRGVAHARRLGGRRVRAAGAGRGGPPRRVADAPGRRVRAQGGDRPAGRAGPRAAARRAGARRAHPRAHARDRLQPRAAAGRPHRRRRAARGREADRRDERLGGEQLPELRRSLVVVSSDIVATAPIPERLREIGWDRRREHHRLADDGRLLPHHPTTAGSRSARARPAALRRPDRHGLRSQRPRSPRWSRPSSAATTRSSPTSRSSTTGAVRSTARTISVPILGHLGGREHIVYGVGWSGNGVGPSVVGGKVLASLALGRRRRVV